MLVKVTDGCCSDYLSPKPHIALWGHEKLVALLSNTLVLASSMPATLTKQLLIDLILLT